MKKTKEVKPSYIVNVDDIEHLDDIACVFAMAKQDAGLPLTDKELIDIVEWAIGEFGTKIYICDMKCPCIKKKPWYKRLWNWITRKK